MKTDRKLDAMALGWALSATLVLLFVLCAAAALVFPGLQLAHAWLGLFSTAAPGSLRNLVDGVVWSIVFGWISAVSMAVVYNRLVRPSEN
jgi:hypothetical protein